MNSLSGLRFAFSPCPNDTFVFAALALGLLGTEWRIASPDLLDIQELNLAAARGEYDVLKVSAAAYTDFHSEYEILPVGAALGFGVGPLLVHRPGVSPNPSPGARVLIPGRQTTAYLLLRHFYGADLRVEECLFSDIMPRLIGGSGDYGLLIHEGRFTFRDLGLELTEDLGARWTEAYASPIPLGFLCARRSLPPRVRRTVAQALSRSVDFARGHWTAVAPYVRAHAQEMGEAVMRQHIDLYVNRHTEQLGEEARTAILRLFAVEGFTPQANEIFL